MASSRHLKMAFAQALARVDVPGRARQTGLVLAHFMGDDGVTWIGQRRLADEWAIGRKRLAADVWALGKAGVLEVATRSGPHGSDRYRSLARFVGDSADIVLEDGTVLPARSSGSALDGAARSSGDALGVDQPPARSSGDALDVECDDPSARSFGGSARSFDRSARSSGDANHPTTTPPSGGGGGGGAVPAAAFASATAAGPAEADARVSEVLDWLGRLVDGKAAVPRHNGKVIAAIAAELNKGWDPESLARVLVDNPLPKKGVDDAARFWLGRLRGIDVPPTVVRAVTDVQAMKPHTLPPHADSTGSEVSSLEWLREARKEFLAAERKPPEDPAVRRLWAQFIGLLVDVRQIRQVAPSMDSLSPQLQEFVRLYEADDLFEQWSDFEQFIGWLEDSADAPPTWAQLEDLVGLGDLIRDALLGECSEQAIAVPDLEVTIQAAAWRHLYELADKVLLVEGCGGPNSSEGRKVCRELAGMVDSYRYPRDGARLHAVQCGRCGSRAQCEHRGQKGWRPSTDFAKSVG